MRVALLLNRQGLTLLELVLVSSMAGLAMFFVASLARTPLPLQRLIQGNDSQVQANQNSNGVVSDLKEASPQSIDWTALPSTSTLAFQKTQYDMTTATTQVSTQMTYLFQPSPDGVTGSLVRIENGVSTVVLNSILTPTTDMPLFQQDPTAYHVVIIQYVYQPLGAPSATVVRRVAIGG